MDSIAADADVFTREYLNALTTALSNLNVETIAKISETLWEAYQNDRQIFFFGNGGSAASASHIVTDLTKGALGHRGDAPARPIRAISLTDNLPLLTAWANDVGYEAVFLGQLRTYLRPGDVVVAISASGNSPNVIQAVRYARETGAIVISLTGFGGGTLAPLADLGIIVDSNHYGIVEDAHMQIGHVFCYYFRQRITSNVTLETAPR